MKVNEHTVYCPTAYQSIPVGNDLHLLHLPLENRTVPLPTWLRQVLTACHGFRTISNHIQSARQLLGGSDDLLPEAVDRLITMDLLKPCAWAAPAEEKSKAPNKISSLGIVTADRPDECLRALMSYDAHLHSYSRTTTMIVMDDSRRFSGLRARLQEQSKLSDGTLRYAGLSEKHSYIAALSKAGIDPDIARFAIIGDVHPDICSIGANRNALLLDTVGENIFSADDDTVCRLRSHPDRIQGLKLECSGNPRDTWFYRDRNELLAESGFGNFDLLGEHEDLLGASAAALVQANRLEQIEGNQICCDLLYAVQNGSGTVLATMSGVIGDSGGYCSKWVLGTRDASRQRLAENEYLFSTALSSRELFGVVQAPTIHHSAFCAATTIALANTYLLPPFLPVGRNEDGVFGTLLRMASPNAFMGHVPIAVLHAASHGREYAPMPEFRLSDLFLSLIARTNTSGHITVSALLRRLGRELLDISSLTDIELTEAIAGAAYERDVKRIRGVSHAVQGPSTTTSQHIEKEVARYKLDLMHLATANPIRVPIELSSAFRGDAFLKMKSILSLIGRFLYTWPDMVEAARYLRGTGQRLSREV